VRGGGWGKTKKKIYPQQKSKKKKIFPQQKSKKKKIFPGIVPKKNSFPGRYRAAQSQGLPKKENLRDVMST
jgi:hypothetical protein